MKFFPLLLVLASSLFSAPVGHELVFEGGKTLSGRVEKITDDSLYFQPGDRRGKVVFPLGDVLFSHDGNGRLFHISDRLKNFVGKAAGRGGTMTTRGGDVIPYVNLEDELFMHNPGLAYRVGGSNLKKQIGLWDIHKLTIDHTLSEYAVKKGFYAGSGLALLTFLSKFRSLREFKDFDKMSSNTLEVYPHAVTFWPLMTLGWVVYDFFRGDRELIIFPLRGGSSGTRE